MLLLGDGSKSRLQTLHLINDGLRIVLVRAVVRSAVTNTDGETPWRPEVLILLVVSLPAASLGHEDTLHILNYFPAVDLHDTAWAFSWQYIKVCFLLSLRHPILPAF